MHMCFCILDLVGDSHANCGKLLSTFMFYTQVNKLDISNVHKLDELNGLSLVRIKYFWYHSQNVSHLMEIICMNLVGFKYVLKYS